MDRKPVFGLQLVQGLPEAPELVLRQETLRAPRPVARHEAAGVAPRRQQSPRLRTVHHPRQRGHRVVRRHRRLAQTVVQLGNMLTAERRNRHLAERRQNVLADHLAVALDRERLAANLRVLAQVPLGKLGHRRPAFGTSPGPRLLARLDPGQERLPPAPCLVRRDRAVPADRDPLRALGAAPLHQIRLGAVGIDPNPEARHVPVPADELPVPRPQAVDHAVRQRLPFRSRHIAAPSDTYAIRAGDKPGSPAETAGSARTKSSSMLPPTRAAATFSASRERCA